MELFRVGGVSSEDLMRPGQNSAKAFLGTMFKMGAPAAQAAFPEEAGELPEDEQPDLTAADAVEDRWTESSLNKLNKEKLAELAGSLGVADLTVTKAKLVEAILAVQ